MKNLPSQLIRQSAQFFWKLVAFIMLLGCSKKIYVDKCIGIKYASIRIIWYCITSYLYLVCTMYIIIWNINQYVQCLPCLRTAVRGDFNIHGTKYFYNAVFRQKLKKYDVVSLPVPLVGQKTCPLHEMLTQLVITENAFRMCFQ